MYLEKNFLTIKVNLIGVLMLSWCLFSAEQTPQSLLWCLHLRKFAKTLKRSKTEMFNFVVKKEKRKKKKEALLCEEPLRGVLTVFKKKEKNFELFSLQNGVELVDLGKRFPTVPWLQKSASIQPRTSRLKN